VGVNVKPCMHQQAHLLRVETLKSKNTEHNVLNVHVHIDICTHTHALFTASAFLIEFDQLNVHQTRVNIVNSVFRGF